MSAPSHKPLGQLMLFLVLVLLSAFILLFTMRAVTPLKQHTSNTPTVTPPSTSSTTSTTGVIPTPDGKSDRPTTSTTPVASTPVRNQPTGTICDDLNYICVGSLKKNATIDNPVVITGTAIAFENTFSWKIEDSAGNLVGQGSAMTDAADVGTPGAFEIRAFWDVLPTTTDGVFTAFESSAKDGSPMHVVRIPVSFVKKTTMKQKVYFLSEKAAQTDCTQVEPTQITLPNSTRPAEATLRALLAIDSSDTPPGFTTLIPDHTHLLSLALTNGVAHVVFDAGLERDGGGSCRVLGIRAQIEKTLTQFSSIRSVTIAVQGKTPEETLQP